MDNQIAVVVTSIASPNRILRELAEGCREHRHSFYVVGDVSSPADFQLDGCEFFSIERQRHLGFLTAERCPERHYSRKNIGYLKAIRDGASIIVETDDDNFPLPEFWRTRTRTVTVPCVSDHGWVNVYRYFTNENIWPRGLPLQFARARAPSLEQCPISELECPIQQGLADDNPDVDAIYRLILPLPVRFRRDRRVALGRGVWCPFNSQNTAFWPDAYPLLYLPAYCSFRMTDIWRSFIAQRICWENDWCVLFHEPTVVQDRNEHNLMRDFRDELPGYLQNDNIREILESLTLRPGREQIGDNMRTCYQALVSASIIPELELPLLDVWIQDLAVMRDATNTSDVSTHA
jgi:STELLO glycosyltransferases